MVVAERTSETECEPRILKRCALRSVPNLVNYRLHEVIHECLGLDPRDIAGEIDTIPSCQEHNTILKSLKIAKASQFSI